MGEKGEDGEWTETPNILRARRPCP